jgi:hypothetical protein
MANRIDAMIVGLGEWDTVCHNLRQEISKSNDSCTAFDRLESALDAIPRDGKDAVPYLALIAAHLNRSFLRTGDLYRAEPDASLDSNYICRERERRTMLSLLAD